MRFVACLVGMWYKAVPVANRGCRDSRATWYFETWEYPLGGSMEVAELKGVIGELEARMTKIRDWL
jgi:hypothetical protein